MEDFFMDSEEERQGIEDSPSPRMKNCIRTSQQIQKDWNRVPTPDDRHISDSSMPDFDDPLDSILRRQLPRQTHYPHSDDSVEETSKVPTDQKVEAPTAKRTRRPPQRFSPPIATEPIPGPSRLPTKTNQPKPRGRPKKDLLQTDKSENEKRPSFEEYTDGL